MPKVTGLFVFPVKSMGGMAVDKVHIGSTGACKGNSCVVSMVATSLFAHIMLHHLQVV